MVNPLTRKLELFGRLAEADRQLLDRIASRPRTVAAHEDIIREGDAPSDVHLVMEGLSCRYKMLPDGNRQIFAYLVPGDFCDLNIFILKRMDHNIATLSDCQIVSVPRARVLELSERPAIARALWWVTLVDEAILREWVVSLGQRDAEQRIAHLFCELHLRMQSIGLLNDDNLELPITQAELADTVGLSTVHVNRSLQKLRNQNLVQFRHKTLSILDIDRLRASCAFNPNYLHLDGGKHDLEQGPDHPL